MRMLLIHPGASLEAPATRAMNATTPGLAECTYHMMGWGEHPRWQSLVDGAQVVLRFADGRHGVGALVDAFQCGGVC